MANLSALAKDKHKKSLLCKLGIAIVTVLSVTAVLFCVLAYAIGHSENNSDKNNATAIVTRLEKMY